MRAYASFFVCACAAWRAPRVARVRGKHQTQKNLSNATPNLFTPSKKQASKTYLEKHLDALPSADQTALILHGLRALAASLHEGELTRANCAVAVAGGGGDFVILEDDDVEPFVQVRARAYVCVCVCVCGQGGGIYWF